MTKEKSLPDLRQTGLDCSFKVLDRMKTTDLAVSTRDREQKRESKEGVFIG